MLTVPFILWAMAFFAISALIVRYSWIAKRAEDFLTEPASRPDHIDQKIDRAALVVLLIFVVSVVSFAAGIGIDSLLQKRLMPVWTLAGGLVALSLVYRRLRRAQGHT